MTENKKTTAGAALVEQETSTEITPMALIQMATSQGADIDKLEKLFELQLRWEENAAKKAYHQAIADFKAEDIRIVKNARVRFTSTKGTTDYKHETLGNVTAQVTEALSRYGLSHSWNIRQNGNQITVICKLSHSLGHSETVEMTAGADNTGNKNSIQQIGSTATYLERYTLRAILGLASHDDDGQASEAQEVETINEQQVLDLISMCHMADRTEKSFCAHFKIKTIDDLPADKYDAAVSALKERGA